MEKIKKNIPNLITISRIISCTLGAVFFVLGNIPVALSCYIYGAVSDAVDGYLARKMNVVSELGKKLDPISDKVYALSLMTPAIILGNYSMIITLLLECLISFVNIYSELKYKKTYTEKVGKIKTILLFPTMILGLLATKAPYLYLLFLPSLIISSEYQAKSLQAYYNQLEKNKKDNIKQITNKNTSEISKMNSSVKKNETMDYRYTKKTSIKKNKKLVRKKD